ncbi:galactosylceramide sulfotransferase-like [Gigantopelta aegis]|uniref:galactosylceramide sulfotransferase-like n=1 Tax=Gigantopelta aegis TaxID=1735272 RepID=UPI001B88C565|nr:galactosylceramide sulfotransferase-like [Gigantopelta aegis]XP_041370923.1 galactosylceramide sulfotransferase-like [Gigantopelta aegis]
MALIRLCPHCRCHKATIACAIFTILMVLNMYVFLRPSVYTRLVPEVDNFCDPHLDHDVAATGSGKKKTVQHLVFLKVHKAASTTVMNIIIRFGLLRNLTFMTPRKMNTISEHGAFLATDILPPFQNGTYDILCNHMIFNKTAISRFFPSDSKYIAILRDPFEQMVSAFMYYKFVYPKSYLLNIAGKNPISTYLENPLKHEPQNPMFSFTFNRMSIDLGYNPKLLLNASVSQATDFIRQLEKDFDLVLIVDYFDESIVLLRRLLGWELKDILYVSANSFKTKSFRFSPEDRLRHQRWAWLDNAIYSHFYKVLWLKIFKQGPAFFDEVHTFQSVRRLVQTFCSQKLNGTDRLKVNKSNWNPEFEVTATDCSLMTMREIPMVDVVRLRHLKRLKDQGINYAIKTYSKISKSKRPSKGPSNKIDSRNKNIS